MLVPILFVGTVFGASLWASKKAAKGAVVATALVNDHVSKKAINHFKNGTNPVYEKHRIREEMKSGDATGVVDVSHLIYYRFTIVKEEVPKKMHHLAHEWMLNEEEMGRLFWVMRRDSILLKAGEDYEKYQKLVDALNKDLKKDLHSLVHGGGIDYSYLEFVSKNRLKDKEFIAANKTRTALLLVGQ